MTILRIVTLASSEGKYGGPFDTARRQCKMMESAGYSVTLLAGKAINDTIDMSSVPAGSKFPVVRRIIPTKNFTGLFSLSMLREIVRSVRNADVVHVSISRELIPVIGMFVTLTMRRRLILQPHGMLTARSSLLHDAIDLVLRPAVRRADTIVALTQREAVSLDEQYGPLERPATVIGNPIPREIKISGPENRVRRMVTFIARLHPRKRVSDFIESAEFAFKSGWNDQYVVVGPDSGDLSLVVHAASRLPNLTYEGTLPGNEVTQLVARSSIFVLTSQDEPWGNVLATALASGIPVVVPASAALANIVESYGAGIVYADGDSELIAKSVHALLEDADAYGLAQENALKLVHQEMSPVTLQRRLELLYSDPPKNA